MKSFSEKRCETIKKRIEGATWKWGAKVHVGRSNYDFTLSILILRPDGARRGFTAGLLNAPINPNETDHWKPIKAPVEPAIKAAIAYASPT